MRTNGDWNGDAVPEEEILVDTSLLLRAVKSRLRVWLWIGPALLVVLLGVGLLLVPQTFTSTASVAVQESSPAGGGALALLSGQSATKRYLGVLKSRSAAEFVEHLVPLKPLYHFDTADDQTEFLIKHVTAVDDSTDGLLYINAAFPGPPKFLPGQSTRRRRVAALSAAVANAYTAALRNYYVNSDTDRDTVLVRDANVEVHKSRAQYNEVAAQLDAFARSLGRYDPRATPSVSSAGAGASGVGGVGPEGTEVAKLYDALTAVNVQIRAAQAAQATQQQLVNGQLQDLTQIPGEDPLLNQARGRVAADRAQLQSLRVQYGLENPDVVLAQQRLAIDEADLAKQVQGVKDHLTTQHVVSASDIESLEARQTALQKQIGQADSRLLTSRQLSVTLGSLQVQAELRLDELKATLEEAAKVRLDNVSGQSRMSVIDTAIPDDHPKPGLTLLAAICVVLVLLAYAAAVLRDYRLASRAAQAQNVFALGQGNGLAAVPVTGVSEETEASAGPVGKRP